MQFSYNYSYVYLYKYSYKLLNYKYTIKTIVYYIQLLLKSLNTPADLLSQLVQSISLILRLYACSTSTILLASVQRPQKMQVRIFNNERTTNQKNAMISLYQYMKLHSTLVFKLLSSNCTWLTQLTVIVLFYHGKEILDIHWHSSPLLRY